jgi:glycosyltransferase involved in cell wall biosynthesis
VLVGLVARWVPQKDHRTFIRAAARLRASLPEVNFLLCGADITWSNPELAAWTEAEGLRPCFHALGERRDVPRLTAALDLAVVSSSSEAYGNVASEAMACGVSCVVTAVGDLPLVVGDTGRVTPPGDPAALAEAMRDILSMSREERKRLGLRARRRIEEHFDLRRAVARYQELYLQLAKTPHGVE